MHAAILQSNVLDSKFKNRNTQNHDQKIIHPLIGLYTSKECRKTIPEQIFERYRDREQEIGSCGLRD